MSLSKRIALIFGSVLFVSGTIYLSRNVIRKFVVQPLFVVATRFYDSYNAIPQQIIWALLIIIVFFIALKPIIKGSPLILGDNQPSRYYPSRVETWEDWLNLASEGTLYQLKVGREVGYLALSTIANREGLSVGEARRKIQNGGILLPEETKKLLKNAPMSGEISPIKRFFKRFSHNNDFSVIMNDIEVTIKYLESELEVHGGKIGS